MLKNKSSSSLKLQLSFFSLDFKQNLPALIQLQPKYDAYCVVRV
jgi:hypothetical protein